MYSCRTQKCSVHVYLPGVAAAATAIALLLLQLMTLLHMAIFLIKS